MKKKRKRGRPKEFLTPEAEQRLDAAMDWLRQNYKTPVKASSLARSVGHCPANFRKDFTNHHGQSVKAARAEFQITEAKRLLLDGMPVTGVAHRCGFGSSTHFLSRFTVIVGKSPADLLRSQAGRPKKGK